MTLVWITFPLLQQHLETFAPAAARQNLTAVLARCLAAIHDSAGYVPRYTGGEVLACFGAPLPLATHAACALHVAFRLHQILHEEMPMRWPGLPLPSPLQIGVHTEPMIVSHIRLYDLHVEFTAMEELQRLAQRLSALAKPGTSVASQATYALVPTEFHWTRIGAMQGTGAGDVVPCYAVMKERPRDDTTAVHATRPDSTPD